MTVKASVTISDAASLHQMTPAAQKLFASLPPEFQSHLESMNDVSAAIATDRTIRMWKIAAEKVTPLASSFFLQRLLSLTIDSTEYFMTLGYFIICESKIMGNHLELSK